MTEDNIPLEEDDDNDDAWADEYDLELEDDK